MSEARLTREVILLIRPAVVMDDLDLDLLRRRAAQAPDWEITVQDTRLSDAPYVAVIARTADLNAEAARQLIAAYTRLPRMRAQLWRRSGPAVPLETVNVAALEAAARPAA